MRFARLKDIARFLDETVDIKSIDDSSVNGLQVGSDKEIKRIGVAVDASIETFEKAKEAFCDMLIVHHGIFWSDKETITGLMYDRIKMLIQNDIALYAVHLPLDKHPSLGNNVQLAKMFNLHYIEPLGDVGMQGVLESERPLESFIRELKEKLNSKITALPFSGVGVKKVAFCSGGGARNIYDAIASGCDTFVTGDQSHSIVHTAKEAKINVIFAGHYATETLGVKALATELKNRFDVEVGFIDVPTGL